MREFSLKEILIEKIPVPLDFLKTLAPWSTQVSRSNQLDAASWALCQCYWQNKSKFENLGAFQKIVLLCPQSSSRTDNLFQKEKSPFLFVHTLPNVRMASFCQLSGWSGDFLSLIASEREFFEVFPNTLDPAVKTCVILMNELGYVSSHSNQFSDATTVEVARSAPGVAQPVSAIAQLESELMQRGNSNFAWSKIRTNSEIDETQAGCVEYEFKWWYL